MRILFIISSLSGGGAERVLSIISNKLYNLGYEVIIATNLDNNLYYDINSGIELSHLALGNSKFKIGSYFKNIRLIRKIIKKHQPDIVIPFITTICVYTILANIGLRNKLIVSEHSNYHMSENNFTQLLGRKFVYKLADKVFVVNKADLVLARKKVSQSFYMPNPISPDFIIGKYSEKKIKVVLMVGSLFRYNSKGFDLAISEIWPHIIKNNPNWVLKIVGDGSQKEISYLSNLAKKHKVDSSVIISKFSSNIQLEYQEASILMVTSNQESFGLSIIEGMSQGCCVLSFDCNNGPRDIIKNDFNGVLVGMNDVSSCIKHLNELMNNKELRDRLVDNAIANVDKYTSDKIVEEWEKHF